MDSANRMCGRACRSWQLEKGHAATQKERYAITYERWSFVDIGLRNISCYYCSSSSNSIAYAAEMEHTTSIQCPIKETAEHGGSIMIFREFRWRGRVLLEDQVSNPYSLARKVISKDEHAPATASLIIFNVILLAFISKSHDSLLQCLVNPDNAHQII